jgi:hypothetical protein
LPHDAVVVDRFADGAARADREAQCSGECEAWRVLSGHDDRGASAEGNRTTSVDGRWMSGSWSKRSCLVESRGKKSYAISASAERRAGAPRRAPFTGRFANL